MLEKRLIAEDRSENAKQGLRNDQCLSAAVTQHEIVIIAGEQCVHCNGHQPGLNRAEKNRWKVDGVRKTEQDSRFNGKAEIGKPIGTSIHTLSQVGKTVTALIVDIGDLGRPCDEIELDQVDSRVIG